MKTTTDAETLHRLAEFGRAVLVTLERDDEWSSDTLDAIANDAGELGGANDDALFTMTDPASLDRAVALAATLARTEG